MSAVAQKAPASSISPQSVQSQDRKRRRAGIQQITSLLMHEAQVQHSLMTTLERNPMADTAMLLTSLLAPVNQCIEAVVLDCRSRGYPEVDEIHKAVVTSVRETHERRSQNAKFHQEKNKRKREKFERESAASNISNETTRPMVSNKAPRSSLHQKYAGDKEEPSI